MKRFILPCPPDGEGLIRLSGEDFHYLVRVRRLGPGDCFQALLPAGQETQIRVRSLAGGMLTGECLAKTEEGGPEKPSAGSVPPIVLFQALPKGTKMDLIVRQAAEGEITEIVPFASEYTIPRLKSGNHSALERWKRIIKEARQQSGSAVPTTIRAPCSFEDLMAYWHSLRRGNAVSGAESARCSGENNPAGVLGLLLHHNPLEQGTFHGYLSGSPALVVLAIGPEGGFSPKEADRFLMEGFNPLLMGNAILRCETAALYAAAAVRIILMERTSWIHRPR
jgi:16S rRNA (uracil1498-N3)-methyltransferase